MAEKQASAGAPYAARSGLRPGEKAYVSPEGIIQGTDGKFRWVYQVNQWKDTAVLVKDLKRFVGLGCAIGVALLAFRLGDGVAQAVRSGLPLLLGLAALGALLALMGYVGNALSSGGKRCVLFTMDETMIRCQPVEGRVSKEKVERVVGAWVGGQSYPELKFKAPLVTQFSAVSTIGPDAKRSLIRVKGVSGVNRIYAEPRQFGFVLEHLTRYCPRAKIKKL